MVNKTITNFEDTIVKISTEFMVGDVLSLVGCKTLQLFEFPLLHQIFIGELVIFEQIILDNNSQLVLVMIDSNKWGIISSYGNIYFKEFFVVKENNWFQRLLKKVGF